RELLADDAYRADISSFVAEVDGAARAKSLSEVALRTLSPGRADVYQGAELWTDYLVDPDNRRPVDFAARERAMERARRESVADLWRDHDDGAVKLAVLQRCLRVRRAHGDEWNDPASYAPLRCQGRVLGFVRGDVAVVVPTATLTPDDDAAITLPAGRWVNAF